MCMVFNMSRLIQAARRAYARAASRAIFRQEGAHPMLLQMTLALSVVTAAAPPPPGSARVAFAEIQHAGRGRRGRSWLAPFGSGLTFSVAWTFAETPPGLPALGLALGVAVAEALRGLGLDEVRLKWPNDVVWRGRKLGGLLLQLKAEAGGAASVVAGLGLNVDLPQTAKTALGTAGGLEAADLRECVLSLAESEGLSLPLVRPRTPRP